MHRAPQTVWDIFLLIQLSQKRLQTDRFHSVNKLSHIVIGLNQLRDHGHCKLKKLRFISLLAFLAVKRPSPLVKARETASSHIISKNPRILGSCSKHYTNYGKVTIFSAVTTSVDRWAVLAVGVGLLSKVENLSLESLWLIHWKLITHGVWWCITSEVPSFHRSREQPS